MTPCDLGKNTQPELNKEDVLDILFDSETRLTSQAYIKAIQSKFSLSFKAASTILRQLVNEQDLCYHSLYGATYVEKSFLKPVRVTDHFVLKPAGSSIAAESNADIEIKIEQGISFGSGQHPTTRLCLEALDQALFQEKWIDLSEKIMSADVGTGSGVLALALCLSGIFFCDAYEIDPVSVNEAKKNVAHNGLEKNVQVFDIPMPEQTDKYGIICANLRFPTLVTLSGMFYSSLKENGLLVLSGVREWEKEKLITSYKKVGMDLLWQEDEKKWSAFVLRKK